MRSILLFTLAGCLLTACSVVTSTNSPGKKADAFPKEMRGEFELLYPESMRTMMEGAGSTTVNISATEAIMTTSESVSILKLNDSIVYSTIKKQGFISLGAAPDFTVLKVVSVGKDFELYPMYTDGNESIEDLKKYFSKVEETVNVEDESGTKTYKVTINDKSLGKYFDSNIPTKEPFLLKRK